MSFIEKKFSKARKNISLLLEEGRRRHIIHTLVEIDVTEARRKIREARRNGRDISFIAWIVRCLAEVMKEEGEFNSFRHGWNRIILFEDVDVAIPVERKNGEARPRAYIIRKANEKSIDEITKEIRMAQKEEITGDTEVIGKLSFIEKFVLRVPSFIQKLILIFIRRNAFLRKKYMGTTGVTSIGMVSGFRGWILTIGGHYTTQVGVGGIENRVVKRNGRILSREYLRIDIGVDHDIIDGAPLARFSSKFAEMLEKSAFLD